MAKSVIEKSAKSKPTSPTDVSLLEMLDTFKSLGLTKSALGERLKKATK